MSTWTLIVEDFERSWSVTEVPSLVTSKLLLDLAVDEEGQADDLDAGRAPGLEREPAEAHALLGRGQRDDVRRLDLVRRRDVAVAVAVARTPRRWCCDFAEVAPSALRPVTTQPIWGSGSPSVIGNASGFWMHVGALRGALDRHVVAHPLEGEGRAPRPAVDLAGERLADDRGAVDRRLLGVARLGRARGRRRRWPARWSPDSRIRTVVFTRGTSSSRLLGRADFDRFGEKSRQVADLR